jgi:hypothetical protein
MVISIDLVKCYGHLVGHVDGDGGPGRGEKELLAMPQFSDVLLYLFIFVTRS